ncbi:hypothetical protein Sj15T_22850 [Sphingobium sp. TA15]|uniref:Putative transposase n=1 Tax=Sphingobium indicum (strain DSM 16413 / CCM 7287 / MTCC 6362 / UT26 / NBRC 101211 / UT26S) TaxID=452662 RepID=D4Z5J2_SPHIU|nr:putative transposase [Sphingobium indicum UT26S]BDD67264.1 hypothetical protein Sj15T_22850 [Sphingobium sp. TA15]
MGDPLKLSAVVDFELFRGPLVAALRRRPRNKGGPPPFDPVLMFNVWPAPLQEVSHGC